MGRAPEPYALTVLIVTPSSRLAAARERPWMRQTVNRSAGVSEVCSSRSARRVSAPICMSNRGHSASHPYSPRTAPEKAAGSRRGARPGAAKIVSLRLTVPPEPSAKRTEIQKSATGVTAVSLGRVTRVARAIVLSTPLCFHPAISVRDAAPSRERRHQVHQAYPSRSPRGAMKSGHRLPGEVARVSAVQTAAISSSERR